MLPNFNRGLIGADMFEDVLNNLHQTVRKNANLAFPPYNIRRVGDNQFVVELAVAGYDLPDIEISLEKNQLSIRSNGHKVDSTSFIHQGFSYKGFERVFSLMPEIVVKTAELNQGILRVFLERIIPEQDKPRTIQINVPQPSAINHPQLLNETSSI